MSERRGVNPCFHRAVHVLTLVRLWRRDADANHEEAETSATPKEDLRKERRNAAKLQKKAVDASKSSNAAVPEGQLAGSVILIITQHDGGVSCIGGERWGQLHPMLHMYVDALG